MSKSKMIVRTKFIDRACHWTVVICFFLVAGISFFFPTLQWLTQTFGTPQMGLTCTCLSRHCDFRRTDVYVCAFAYHNIPDKKDILRLLNIVEVLKGNEHKVADVGGTCRAKDDVLVDHEHAIFVLLRPGVISGVRILRSTS